MYVDVYLHAVLSVLHGFTEVFKNFKIFELERLSIDDNVKKVLTF